MVKAREIKEIRKNEPEGQYRFTIVKTKEGYRLVADFKPSSFASYRRSQMVNFAVASKRLIQLANEILNHFKKEAKWKEWKPTMEELEIKLNERYHGDGIYMWLINWMRLPWNKKIAKRIFEWLDGANDREWFKDV